MCARPYGSVSREAVAEALLSERVAITPRMPGWLLKKEQIYRLNAAQLGERSQLSRSFLYQLCSGQRVPGRDIVLRLALVLELSVDQAQSLLRHHLPTVDGRSRVGTERRNDIL